jgi:hypothetical protein
VQVEEPRGTLQQAPSSSLGRAPEEDGNAAPVGALLLLAIFTLAGFLILLGKLSNTHAQKAFFKKKSHVYFYLFLNFL